jgi:hypothetical protein
MSSTTRINLKTQFASGTAATATKFENLIDSAYNTNEDSVLIGPIGQTGTNGLVGPSGATHYNGLIGPSGSAYYNGLLGPTGSTHYIGLWLLPGSSAPTGPTASGSTGSVIISGTSVYVCTSLDNWVVLTGSTSF